ncbi:hypothetical protein [Novosphingobium olei]|uniref:Uncharacterized protein n=1 Tax=Novosphingobium olei TaxID=2728851 RepID=A0A7Y0BRX8_9SPHN|nr:hypothetical protein [Novosphingobium olei]NML95343.1 hypothetical protein [Novosphingobium olei]
MTRRRPFRLWAILLVLVVALQALAPMGGGLSLRSGSAFSADTVEVAVAPARRVAEAAVAPLPAPLPTVAALVIPLSLMLVATWRPKPRQTAPPRLDPAFPQRLEPRAPPRP